MTISQLYGWTERVMKGGHDMMILAYIAIVVRSFAVSDFLGSGKVNTIWRKKRGRETDREISVPYLFFEPALIPLFRLIRHLKWRVEKTPFFFHVLFFLTK